MGAVISPQRESMSATSNDREIDGMTEEIEECNIPDEAHEVAVEKTTSLDWAAHKYKSRIGRWDDEQKNWVNEIQWESSQTGRARNSKEGDFILRIEERKNIEFLVILSQYIRKIFVQAVRLYSGVKIENNYIEMEYPYPALFHYFDEIQRLAEDDESEEAGAEDFSVLKWYYETYLLDKYNKARRVIEFGNITFDYLWALFRPGDLVVTTDVLGHQQLHILTISQYILEKQREDEFVMKVWSMVWSPSRQSFRRSLWKFWIGRFPGSRSILSLDLFPLSCQNTETQERLKLELSKRGNFWKKLVSERPTCWHCEGAVFDGKAGSRRANPSAGKIMKTTNISERVMVDQNEEFDIFSMIRSADENLDESVVATDARQEFTAYDDQSPTVEFTPFQAMLCPPVTTCFCMETQKWRTVAVKDLTEVRWNKLAFDQLVLQKRTKSLLSGLISQHSAGIQGTSDFIKDKGKGLTFVLYGPSGVGKSFTAESLAEYNELPLRPINISSLVSNSGGPDLLALSRIFEEAKRWDAILLLDEADVVLEKRALEDVRRNTLVSAFLRELEYFTGILFLTTNRIETMDNAFQSRIQIAIEYKPLGTSSRRQIWEAFIETLPSQDEKDELEPHLDSLKKHLLNGRQIRNAMNLARSFALNDVSSGRDLSYEHLKQAVEETIKFQELFGKLNEPKRLVSKSIPRRGTTKDADSDSDDE